MYILEWDLRGYDNNNVTTIDVDMCLVMCYSECEMLGCVSFGMKHLKDCSQVREMLYQL